MTSPWKGVWTLLRCHLIQANTHIQQLLPHTDACYVRVSEAEHQGKKALELLEVSPGANSLPFADCLFSLAAVYMTQQRWVTAATSSRKCLAVRYND